MNHEIHDSRRNGFTLLEMMIALAITMLLAVAGIGFYRNFSKSVELDATARNMIADLRNARVKAMGGEDQMKWGIRFRNGTPDDDYQLFSTPTNYASASTSIKDTTILKGGIAFTSPSSGNNTDVIFDRVYGSTTPATVSIASENNSKTITITALGTIY